MSLEPIDPKKWAQLQAIFLEAVERPHSERESWVRKTLGDDPVSAETVLAMIDADEEDGSLVDEGLAGMALATLASSREPFEDLHFGPYKLLRMIGEGGMGVVYLAENPINGQRVAIKILLDARLSPARRERFNHEQKMLGALEHKNIARLHHADLLENGTPWFAMEYVGASETTAAPLPITEYCRAHALDLRERLRLFHTVCDAVQYVHSKMLVHRDLKPSNILVTADGSVKLIDFGIGKDLAEENGASGMTAAGIRLMTLEYAAPEQIRGGEALPATDVYALGVVLYELLTDGHPFELKNCSAFEIERKLTEENAPRPSQRAHETGRANVATKGEWRDLDALVAKAMHKDAEQRYGSVEALVGDLENFLHSRPLVARPDGWRYTTSRFIKRNRRALAASGVVGVLLVGMTVFYTVSLMRARDAALEEKERTQRVVDFMLQLLKNGDDEVAPATEMKVTDLVERGVKNAEGMQNDPQVQAVLLDTFGGIFQSWGQADRAYKLLDAGAKERAAIFGHESPEAAENLMHLGSWHNDQDELPAAEKIFRQVLAIQQKKLEPMDTALERTHTALGLVLQRQGEYLPSMDALNRAIAIGQHHPEDPVDLSAALGLQANNYYYLGRYEESEKLNREGLELDRKIHGPRHPDISDDLINIGNIEFQRDDFAGAERDFRQAYQICVAWFGPDHKSVADSELYLSKALRMEGKVDEAESLLRHGYAVMSKQKKPTTTLAMIVDELGKVAVKRNDLDEAEKQYRESIALFTTIHGKDHPSTLTIRGNLADLYTRKKDAKKADAMMREILAAYARRSTTEPLQLGIAHLRMGRALRLEGKNHEALAEITQGIQLVSSKSGEKSNWLAEAYGDLGAVYEALGDKAKADAARAKLAAQNHK